MQPKSNIELKNAIAGKRKGMLGTILVHAGLVSLLLLVSFSSPPPPEGEEGILVNFGTDETGIGMIEPSPPPGVKESAPPVISEVKQTPVPPKTAAKSNEEPMLTQNSEDAPAVKKVEKVVKKVDPEAEKKRLEKLEEDRIIKEQKEAERIRIREEQAEKQRIAAEQQREAEIMNRTKNALANSKNTGTSSTGEGIAGGPGNQGDINGSIDSKVRGHGSGLGDSGTGTGASGNGTGSGVSYSLGGRGFIALPRPNYKIQVEGKVVVEVSVDKEGKVIQANPGVKGSTTLDESLLKVAKDAAMAARFEVKNDAPAIQKGTITYNFKLN